MECCKHTFSSIVAIAVSLLITCGLYGQANAQMTGNGETGGAAMVGVTASATVKAVDADQRLVTLEMPDGKTVQVRCGPQVRNFGQIQVGDEVKAAAIARLVVAVGKGASPNADAGVIIARAPKGARPGAIIVRTEVVAARIDAVDPEKQTVTLSGIDGEPQTVKVASDVDLSSVKAGDDVSVKLTKGLALWVQKPSEAAAPTDMEGREAQPAAFALVGKSATATVEAIDQAKRLVTIKSADGQTKVIHLGKQCVNFDQIKVGDQVRATVAEEVAIAVSKSGEPGGLGGTMIALAPKGAKPGMLIADTEDVKAQIKSIDADKGTLTLSEADGAARTVKAGPNVRLSELNVGDDITARITQAMAIVVEKPE